MTLKFLRIIYILCRTLCNVNLYPRK